MNKINQTKTFKNMKVKVKNKGNKKNILTKIIMLMNKEYKIKSFIALLLFIFYIKKELTNNKRYCTIAI